MKIIFNKKSQIPVLTGKFLLFTLLVLLLLATACQPQPEPFNEKPTVTVSIVPQKYFVERLAGDAFKVNVMVQAGQSPENYEPTPAQMVAISNSAAYILIGASFEDIWIEKLKAANPNLLFFDSSTGVERLSMQSHHHEEDVQPALTPEQTNEIDPHIWTSPIVMKIVSRQMADLLVQLEPGRRVEIESNLEILINELEALDSEIANQLADLPHRTFMVYHPTWGYFAHDYDLEQISVEESGSEPSAQELADIITLAKQESIPLIIVQPEFSQRSAQTIADEIGAKILPISSLAYDWFSTLRSFAAALVESNS